MSYQEIYRGLNKRASNEQIKKLASLIHKKAAPEYTTDTYGRRKRVKQHPVDNILPAISYGINNMKGSYRDYLLPLLNGDRKAQIDTSLQHIPRMIAGRQRPQNKVLPALSGAFQYFDTQKYPTIEGLRRAQANEIIGYDPERDPEQSKIGHDYLMRNGKHHFDLFRKGKFKFGPDQKFNLPLPENLTDPKLRERILNNRDRVASNNQASQTQQYS